METVMLDQNEGNVEEVFTSSALDKCDARCNGQAYHKVMKDGKDLLFCNHHFVEFEDRLVLGGWSVTSDVSALAELGVKQYIYSEQ